MHIIIDTTKEIIALNSIIRTFNDADIDVTIHDIEMHYLNVCQKTVRSLASPMNDLTNIVC